MSQDAVSTHGKPAEGGHPITIIRTRRAQPGREKEVEEVLNGLIEAAKTFPGHRGAKLLPPTNPDDPEYEMVFTFDNRENFDRFDQSETRKQWMERLRPLMDTEVKTHVLTGLETWFTVGAPNKAIVPPPRYKMVLATWLGLFPLVTTLNLAFTWCLDYLLVPLLGGKPAPYDLHWLINLVLRTFYYTGVTALLMAYVVMPRVTYILRPWLYPRGVK